MTVMVHYVVYRLLEQHCKGERIRLVFCVCVDMTVMVHYVVYILHVHYTKCGDMMLHNYTQSRSTNCLLPDENQSVLL